MGVTMAILIAGVVPGIILGLLLSLISILVEVSRPGDAVLRRPSAMTAGSTIVAMTKRRKASPAC
jgi:MFS superfamily sulfate permease-like transporter